MSYFNFCSLLFRKKSSSSSSDEDDKSFSSNVDDYVEYPVSTFAFVTYMILNFAGFHTGWAKKVIPLVHYITLYERYHFFGTPCMLPAY